MNTQGHYPKCRRATLLLSLLLAVFLSVPPAGLVHAQGGSGTLYVSSQNTVLHFDSAGLPLGVFGQADLANSGLNNAAGLKWGPDGNLYVASFNSGQVLRYDASGNFLGVFATVGTPAGLAFGPGGALYVTSYFGNTVERFASDGTPLGTFISGLSNPDNLAWGPDGNLYVTNRFNSEVLRFTATGAALGVFGQANQPGSGLVQPSGLVFSGSTLYVAGWANNAIYRYDAAGTSLGQFTGGGLTNPAGITFGPDGNLYVASYSSGQVLRFNAGGTFVDAFAAMTQPASVAFQPVISNGGGPTTGVACYNDGRENSICWEPWATAVVYCEAGAINIYQVNDDSTGTLVISATPAEIAAVGVPAVNTLIEASADGTIRLYRLNTGEFQVNAPRESDPNGYVFIWDGCDF